MAWTNPFTAVSAAVALASDWNTSGRDNLLYLKDRIDNPPRAAVTHSTTQSIGTGTDTVISMNSEYADSAALHDTVTNNSRITVPNGQGGWWAAGAYVEFAANATGQRKLFLQESASFIFTHTVVDAAASGVTRLAVAGLAPMGAAYYIETAVSQNSGGALNLAASPFFSAQRIA